MQTDKIFIIGSGAIGKALAVLLTLGGRPVTLIRGSVDDGSSRREQLSVVLEDGTVKRAEVEIATLSAFQALEGIVVLATKSYGNEGLSKILQEKAGISPLVLLQNGLGVEQPFLSKGFEHVYRGVLFVTSQTLEDKSVRFKPVSACPIGLIKGHSSQLAQIVEQLTTEHFRFKPESNIGRIIWKKAIINSVFNSVCPLLDTDNGVFYRYEAAFRIARRIISECIGIAREEGVLLDPGEVEESLLQISQSSDGQLISTLQDIRRKRSTEIETLNLEIARIARSRNKEAAVKETGLLGELTKLKADLSQQLAG